MLKGYGIIFVRRDGERSPLGLPGNWRLDEDQAQSICDSLNADLKDDAGGMYFPIEVDDDMDNAPLKMNKPRAV